MAVRVGDGAVLRACQSENISVSGMLIRTSEEFPIGSQVRLEFALTDDDEPLVCLAEVVRYTEPVKEKIRGMGVNFLSFEDDGWSRLEGFLAA
jgi:Tfp pilus assembly protein PilZ